MVQFLSANCKTKQTKLKTDRMMAHLLGQMNQIYQGGVGSFFFFVSDKEHKKYPCTLRIQCNSYF